MRQEKFFPVALIILAEFVVWSDSLASVDERREADRDDGQV
jgi:hypothetical protein